MNELEVIANKYQETIDTYRLNFVGGHPGVWSLDIPGFFVFSTIDGSDWDEPRLEILTIDELKKWYEEYQKDEDA